MPDRPSRAGRAPRSAGQGERSWSLRRRLAQASVLLSLLAALLVLAAGVTLGAMARTQQRVVGELSDAVVDSALMFRSMVDQESGLRGYVLSADPSFLQPYEAGVRQEDTSYAALVRSYADDPELLAAVTRLRETAAGWRAEIAAPRIEQVARQGGESVTQQQLDDGRDRFERVRAANATHRDLLLATRQRERDRLSAETGLLVGIFVLTAATAVVAGLAVWAALRRWVRRPLADLAHEVQKVQSGHLEHRVAVRGPQEIVAVADDVDAMRRQLVEQYAGAVQARRDAEVARQRQEQSARRLADSARELERSNRDLEQFAYVASHDLQEPLRKVASFCQMLERRYKGQLDDRADQYIAFAVDGAKRMQVLINDLLAFSRVGRGTAGFAAVDLGDCARRAFQALDPLLADSGGRVYVAELPVVPGEASLLTQLFQNLIGNAVKFARPGVAPEVQIGVRRDGEMWEVSVRDNGIGIEPAYAEKIFVIFQRLHAKEQYGGTGIGLALCKKIVEYHGGRIWLDSAGDGSAGTTIRFTLPVEQRAAPAVVQEDTAQEDTMAGAPA